MIIHIFTLHMYKKSLKGYSVFLEIFWSSYFLDSQNRKKHYAHYCPLHFFFFIFLMRLIPLCIKVLPISAVVAVIRIHGAIKKGNRFWVEKWVGLVQKEKSNSICRVFKTKTIMRKSLKNKGKNTKLTKIDRQVRFIKKCKKKIIYLTKKTNKLFLIYTSGLPYDLFI